MSFLTTLGFGRGGWGFLLLHAAAMTLAVTMAALALGAAIGALIAAAKLSRVRALVLIGDLYTTVFRAVPELLIIYGIYFGGSSIIMALGHVVGYHGFIAFPPFLAGTIAVGTISGAYQSEVFRGSFLAISRGELEAASAIGMPRTVCFRRIVIPQVLRFALPGLNYVFQLSVKDSSLISVTGLVEIMRASEIGGGSTHQYFVFYLAGASLYLVITSISEIVFGSAERQVARTFKRSIT